MKKLGLILLVGITLISCSKKDDDGVHHGYFTYEYQNGAWGYQHEGWMMDEKGKVSSFNLPEHWNGVDSLGYISEAELIENLENCENKIDHVSSRKLSSKNQLVATAVNGDYSERRNLGDDLGRIQYICYNWNSTLNLYQKVVLEESGDISYQNLSSEAQEIIKWMKKIK